MVKLRKFGTFDMLTGSVTRNFRHYMHIGLLQPVLVVIDECIVFKCLQIICVPDIMTYELRQMFQKKLHL